MKLALLPYTWTRHVQPALFVGGAAVLAWSMVVTLLTTGHPWGPQWDGAMYLGAVAAATAGASTAGEVWLRGRRTARAWVGPGVAAACAGLFVIGWLGLYGRWIAPLVFGEGDAAEATLVSLRYHLVPWLVCGGSVGAVTAAVRRLRGVVVHLGAGCAAGLLGAAAWYAAGYAKFAVGPMDLFAGGAFGALAFGGTFGGLAWGVPDAVYVGWVRVLSAAHHGRRVPVDGADGGPRERFVGAWLRGLDLYLPDPGVSELHVSVGVDAAQAYRARGLTLQPTAVRRFLERIDLRYDPARPAPLETPLHSGDRIVLADGHAVVEFLLLPREET